MKKATIHTYTLLYLCL